MRLRSVVAGNCILYFPFNRFEDPAWLNRGNLTAQAEFADRQPMLAHTERRAIATSPLEQNRNWLVDVIYDRRVSETRSVRVPLPSPGEDKPWYVEAEQAETRDHDESVLRTALEIVRTILLDETNASFRLGRRHHRFVALHGDNGLIVPNIFQLSSGETSLLNIFLSILRDFEWGGSRFSDTTDVRGTVVVDEIDLHLHTLHQFEVLPLLIRMFPRVQFILTTHSPLFVLGMTQVLGEAGFALHRLPDGHRISPEEFSEFGDAYSAFSSTRRFVDDLEEAVRTATSPVLLTEGDTDCRYLERAAELLGKEATLDSFVVRAADGSANLTKVWRHPMPGLFAQKVLLLFDCDENKPNGNRGQILQRSVPFCPDNPIPSGIENLFSRQTLEKARLHSSAFIDIEHEHQRTHRGVQAVIPEKWAVNSDEKTNLCDWLCENGTAEDFAHFQAVFDLLEEAIDAIPQSQTRLSP
ncbi:MAG: AAA family ATPase, partial [Chloroflexi bacterium]|nr:AAA family ATPase [Chloroflexota bacterium]